MRPHFYRFCKLLLSSGSNFCRDLADSRQLLSSAKNLLPSRYANYCNFDLQVNLNNYCGSYTLQTLYSLADFKRTPMSSTSVRPLRSAVVAPDVIHYDVILP